MTNGGLATIRSKRSSGTGSKRSPKATRTWARSLSCIVSVARAIARGLTSDATTRSLWAAACTACTPQPVPRSKAAPIGRRIVAPASAVVDALTPSTWSADSEPGGPGRSWTTRWSPVSPSGRTTTLPRTSSPSTSIRCRAAQPSTASGDRAGRGERVRHRDADEEQPHEDIEAIEPARGVGEGCELAPRQVREGVRTEPSDDVVERVAGVVERRAQWRCGRHDPIVRGPGAVVSGRGRWNG